MIPLQVEQKIEKELLELWQSDPQATVRAIVRTKAAAASRRAEVEAAGITVRRLFRLVPSLAVRGRATDLVELAERSWVKAISLDRDVHVMDSATVAKRGARHGKPEA